MNTPLQAQTQSRDSDFKKKIILIPILLVLLIGSFLFYRHMHAFESTDNAQIDGNIIPLRTKITGYVSQVRFHDNQHVNKGDTLVIFETTDLQSQVTQARARLENAMAGTEISKTSRTAASQVTSAADFSALAAQENIAAAKARLDQAQSDFNRTKQLYEKNASTAQAFDAAQSALNMAQAQYLSAQKQYQALTAQKANATSQVALQGLQMQASRSRVSESQAQLDVALYQLSNAYIIAPCSGIISKKSVECGQMILAGSALAMLIDDSDMWITANFKETQLDRLKNGQHVSARIDAYKNVSINGVIESTAGASGAKFALLPPDNASGNFVKVTQRVPVHISLANVVNPDKRALFPGLSVTVRVAVQ